MAAFKIGVMNDSFRLNFEDSIAKSAEYGADGVQLSVRFGEFSPERMTRDKIRWIKNVLNEHSLVISAVCGDLGGNGFTVPEENDAKVDISKRILEIAQELGTNIVTTHIGVVPENQNCKRFETLWKACDAMGSYADDLGMKFAIETGPEKSATLKAFLDTLPSKGMGVNLDPANLVMVTQDDPVQAVYNLKDYIVHTHAKDGKNLVPCDAETVYHNFADEKLEAITYFIETPLGEGNVDFNAYLAALKEIGYSGFLTIEREVGSQPEKDIATAIDFLKAKI